MSDHLTPLEVCERIFGHLEQVATVAGLHPKSGYFWRRAAKFRDAGDLPSMRIARRLLAEAEAQGLPLQPAWLIRGASRDEIEMALSAPREAA